jgi:hypothetical protein
MDVTFSPVCLSSRPVDEAANHGMSTPSVRTILKIRTDDALSYATHDAAADEYVLHRARIQYSDAVRRARK